METNKLQQSLYNMVQYNMVPHIDGLVQDCSNPTANTLELLNCSFALSHQYNTALENTLTDQTQLAKDAHMIFLLHR